MPGVMRFDPIQSVDVSPLVGALVGFGQQRRQKQFEQEVDQNISGALEGGEEEFARLASMDPNAANAVQGLLQRRDARQIAQAQQQTEARLRDLASIYEIDDQTARNRAMVRIAQQNPALAGELQRIMSIGDKTDQDIALLRELRAGQDIQAVIGRALGTTQGRQINAPVTNSEGTLGFPTIDKTTGEASFIPVLGQDGQPIKQTTPQEAANLAISEAQGKERAKIVEQQRGEIRKTINQNAITARRRLPELRRIVEGVEKIGTGTAQEIKRLIGPYLPGVDPTNEQALNASLNTLVFDVLAQFTGAISEGERAFAQQTVARMGNTTEANLLILNRLMGRMDSMIEEQKQFRSFKGNPEDFVFEPADSDRPLTKSELEEYNRLKAATNG